MAQNGAKGAGQTRVSPIKPRLRGASRLVQSRVHAGLRAATLNRRSALNSAAGLLAALAVLFFLALWLGGYLPAVKQNISDTKRDTLMSMGFTVDHIDVMGEGRLNEADVRAAVGIYPGDYFFAADLQRAQERTESLPWVDRAVVRRLWPNRIVVQLVETTPYAIYQQQGVLHLTDLDGALVAPLDADTARLPEGLRVFTGPQAAEHAAEITRVVQGQPRIWAQTTALTRHASGRWDLHLQSGLLLRLRHGHEARSLQQFAQLSPEQAAQYAVVDLRLADRITLTPIHPTTT